MRAWEAEILTFQAPPVAPTDPSRPSICSNEGQVHRRGFRNFTNYRATAAVVMQRHVEDSPEPKTTRALPRLVV
jgi:hypothetical protein